MWTSPEVALEPNTDEVVWVVELVVFEVLPVNECREIVNVVECECVSDSEAKGDQEQRYSRCFNQFSAMFSISVRFKHPLDDQPPRCGRTKQR